MLEKTKRLSGIGITLVLGLCCWWSISTIAFHYANHNRDHLASMPRHPSPPNQTTGHCTSRLPVLIDHNAAGQGVIIAFGSLYKAPAPAR